jgi:transcriptional regulator with XRE-family HTH domain
MITIGKQLRKLRDERGITARQLSERSGVAQAMISRLENGRQEPTLSTMTKLADYFGVPLDALRDEPGGSVGDQPSELEAALSVVAQRAKAGDSEALREMRRLYAALAAADAARASIERLPAASEQKPRQIRKK